MLRAIIPLALFAALAACADSPQYRNPSVPVTAVAAVDLARYSGRWYEVARFPVWFQEGCVAVTADYAIRDDGRVDVLNTCRQGGLDGPVETAEAIARPVDASNARLKVNFAPPLPFEGDYWVLYLDDDYRTAVVGTPSGSAGWILSRTPQIEPARLDAARDALVHNGYDIDRLTLTAQPE